MAKRPNDIVAVLYGSEVQFKKAVAFCKFHHCHLTKNQVLTKGCLGKQCKALDKLPHDWWEERELKKLKKKEGKGKC